MRMMLTKAAIVTGAAAATFVAAAPAEAQRYHRYRDRGGDVAAGAIVGGIVGLGLGAAIASSNRDRYYDRGYYGRPYYGGYYDRRDYRPYRAYRPYRGYYRQRCVTRRVYDPYIGRSVRVRYC